VRLLSVVCLLCTQGYTIPEGDMLMLSPYWCHRNPTLFPEPELFQPVCVFLSTFTFLVFVGINLATLTCILLFQTVYFVVESVK